jgi:hypothetical protein
MHEFELFAAQLSKEDELAVEATGNTALFYGRRPCRPGPCGEPRPVQGHQPVGEEDRQERCRTAGPCICQRFVAGGADERMKERSQREVHHLAQTRDLLVKQRSALKAKINNLLSAEGINLKRESLSSNKALDRVLALPLSPIVAAEARVLVAQIRSLTGSIAELEELIEEEGSKLDGHENLMSIKGIGPVSQRSGVAEHHRTNRRLPRS